MAAVGVLAAHNGNHINHLAELDLLNPFVDLKYVLRLGERQQLLILERLSVHHLLGYVELVSSP